MGPKQAESERSAGRTSERAASKRLSSSDVVVTSATSDERARDESLAPLDGENFLATTSSEGPKLRSCDSAIRSIDSALARLSPSLHPPPPTAAHSDNETAEDSLSAFSRNSSLETGVSESLVDAERAGIIGVLYGGGEGQKPASSASTSRPEPTSSVPSLRTILTALPGEAGEKLPTLVHPTARRSIITDPGALPEIESPRHGRNPSSYGRAIGEDHANFVLMYDMLTGIRHSVSVCQAKPSRPLTSEDFSYARTYNFLQSSNETTPSKYEFRFKDYCPWVFRSLREAFRIDAADYLVSLTGKYALSEIGSPGKSGSFFYFSQDFRYIIKTIRQSEHVFLRKILRHYFDHIKRNPNSLLTRFYGLHRVRMSNIRKIYFVVMGNIFPPHKDIHETYDLKGSSLGRFITPEESANKHLATLKDLNWLQQKRKLKLGPEKATMLMNQLRADCMFLSKVKIMDYSLLVGIHYSSRGNLENLREKSMMILEPTTPLGMTEKQKRNRAPPPPAFRQTSITALDSSVPLE